MFIIFLPFFVLCQNESIKEGADISDESVIASATQPQNKAPPSKYAATSPNDSFNVSVYLPETEESSFDNSQDPQVSENTKLKQKRQSLNDFLKLSDQKPVLSSLKKPWKETDQRNQRRYLKYAKDGIRAVIDVIAPQTENASSLWAEVKQTDIYGTATSDQQSQLSTEDHQLLEALAECYENAEHWATRRQILSIMAEKVSFKELQQFIAGLTRYMFTIARKHTFIHGRGVRPETDTGPRIRFDSAKLSHFLEFITSPHLIQDLPFGERMLKLSTGEVVYTPNVIRIMIPERIIQQYRCLCEETGYLPLSDSTLKRILKSCAASVRTSLQGLDYFTSEGISHINF